MCGIAGVYNFDGQPVEENLLLEMGRLIEHRGPDDQGVYSQGGVGLVNRRLAIIDLSQSGHQPMSNAEGDIWITYNGEVYNFPEIRRELENKGYRFRSGTDTEVILYAYQEWGLDHCKKLRGMFAYAIWDARIRRLILVRDRLGQKPLNYALTPSGLVFGSELRTLFLYPEVQRKVDLNAIHAFLMRVYVPAPLSAFEGIHKLPPAHYLVAEEGELKIERYWELDFGENWHASEPEYCEALIEHLDKATHMRLISDVPLGAFLSGGIDSSAVVGLMSRHSPRPVKTFSIHFEEEEFNETPYARQVANYFGTEHQEFSVRPDAMKVLPDLVWHFGEPFGDYSSIPTYYVSKLARQHVTVVLSGDAGDEDFAGYNRYRTAQMLDIYRMLPEAIRKNMIPNLLKSLGFLSGRQQTFDRLATVAQRGAVPLVKDYFYSYSFFTPEAAAELWRSDWAETIQQDFLPSHLEGQLSRFKGNNTLERWQFLDFESYLPDDINVKVDIASMANSLEVRSPFLDHELVEFAAKLPAGVKRKGGVGKYILKKALEPMLPHDVLYRKKHGFSVPVDRWFRGPLKDLVRSVLLDPATQKRGYFEQKKVEQLIDQHESGRWQHGMRLWLLLNFELWQRTYIDDFRTSPLSLEP